ACSPHRACAGCSSGMGDSRAGRGARSPACSRRWRCASRSTRANEQGGARAMILSDTQAMVRDTMRAFAQERLWPNAPAWDRDHHFPREELRALGALGALGMVVAEVD